MNHATLKKWLLASVVLNAFLIGMNSHWVRGHFHPHDHMFGDHGPDGHGPGGHGPGEIMGRMIPEMTRDMSEADATIVRQAFEAEKPQLDKDRHDSAPLHEQIRAALLAEPFDADRLQSIFDQEALTHADFGRAIGRAVVNAAKQLSPDGRKKLADFRPGGPPPR